MENIKANTCNAVTAVPNEKNSSDHAKMFPKIVPVLCGCSILLLSLVLVYSPRHPYRVARV